jgi:hypothetical protein
LIGRDDRRLLAFGRELLDVGDDRLVVGVAERRVLLHDVGVGDALAVQERAQDLVGRARIDVVGAEEDEALGRAAVLAHQVLDRGDRLLVRGGTRVEDVLRELLALVLHGIEEQRVVLLEHRQHGLARDAGPAAEHDRHLVLRDQLLGLLGEQRPVRRRVDDHGLELLAEHAALGVDLVDRHQDGVLEHGLGDRHRSRQRVQDAHLDGIGRERGHRDEAGDGECRAGGLEREATFHEGSSEWSDGHA